ncbi:hypothetical protein HK098_006075 [Nowakowskiella sp. JEL0407]|nr:hypothetical protein HK098_006075 [Nowakowskiella sp. JEL0407]
MDKIFETLGLKFARHHSGRTAKTANKRFRALFGITPKICSLIWQSLVSKPSGSKPEHLLYALLFLKLYDTEHAHHAITGSDEKTFRKWTWIFIELIADLDIIKWEDRHHLAPPNAHTFVSLDGTDFKIAEPSPFNKKWFSHKFHGPGVRYEIGLCIRTGKIVWAHGGLPCGDWPDLRLARNAYTDMVEAGEMTLADKGYRDEQYFIFPSDGDKSSHRQKKIMARHETVNRRLKNFGVLKKVFRHKLKYHPICFYAVANITQLLICNGEPLYSIM